MQTFDQALYKLYKAGEITYEDAIAHADSKNDLRLLIKLKDGTDASYLADTGDDLLVAEDSVDSFNLYSRDKKL